MKKKMFFLTVVMMAAVSVYGQMSSYDKNKIKDVNQEIGRLEKQIAERNIEIVDIIDYGPNIKIVQHEIDSISKLTFATDLGNSDKAKTLTAKNKTLHAFVIKQNASKNNFWKIADRDSMLVKVTRYKALRDEIFQRYTAKTLPEELSSYELAKRLRGVELERTIRLENERARRAELTFKKLKNNKVIGDSINGFTGVIANRYWRSIKFQFVPLDEGEHKSIEVGPGRIITEKLIPGRYLVHFFDGDKELGQPKKMTVGLEVTSYDGIDCHWFAYMPN